MRCSVTVRTPGWVANRAAMSGLRPLAPSMAPESMITVPRKSSRNAPAPEDLTEAAKMARKLTRATPIISDDAVRAVRFGLRIAFWRAIAPAVPRNRASGAPRAAATGRARTGPRTDTATMRAERAGADDPGVRGAAADEHDGHGAQRGQATGDEPACRHRGAVLSDVPKGRDRRERERRAGPGARRQPG